MFCGNVMQRITERRNNVVITDRMWARLLSSTNQPSFIDVEVSNEDENGKNPLDRLADGHCLEDTLVDENGSISTAIAC